MAHQVEIFGQIYALRADVDEQHVRRVAEFVDLKMREVSASSRSVSTLQIAVLAALDIASELLQSRAVAEQLNTEVETRSESMVRRIADSMSEVRVF